MQLQAIVQLNAFILLDIFNFVMVSGVVEIGQRNVQGGFFNGNRVMHFNAVKAFTPRGNIATDRLQAIRSSEQFIGNVYRQIVKSKAAATARQGKSTVQEIPYVSDRIFNEALAGWKKDKEASQRNNAFIPSQGGLRQGFGQQFGIGVSERNPVEIYDREIKNARLQKIGAPGSISPAKLFRPGGVDFASPSSSYGGRQFPFDYLNRSNNVQTGGNSAKGQWHIYSSRPKSNSAQPPAVQPPSDGFNRQNSVQLGRPFEKGIQTVNAGNGNSIIRPIRPPGTDERIPLSLANIPNIIQDERNGNGPSFVHPGEAGLRIRQKIHSPFDKNGEIPAIHPPATATDSGKLKHSTGTPSGNDNFLDKNNNDLKIHAEEEGKGDNQELEGFASNQIGTGEESEGGLTPEDIEGGEEMAVALEMVAGVIEAGAAAIGVIATSLEAGVKTQNVAEAEGALGTHSALPLNAIRDDVLIAKQETTNPEHEHEHELQKLKTEQIASQLEVLVTVMESAAAAVAIAGAAVASDVIHKEKELFKASHGNENISPAIIGVGG